MFRLTARNRIHFIPWLMLICSLQANATFLETTDNKALFQLQPFKKEMNASYETGPYKSATLLNINTHINTWYLLDLRNRGRGETTINLLTADDKILVFLDKKNPELLVSYRGKRGYACNIEKEIAEPYDEQKRSKLSYIPACSNLLLIVIKQNGYQSSIEKGAEFLRWLGGDVGEDVINEVKESYFKDKYIVEEQTEESEETPEETDGGSVLPRAVIDERYLKTTIPTRHLGLKTEKSAERLLAGKWYSLKNYPNVYTSMIMPGMVSREILASYKDRVNWLDGVERNAVVYLMSFSLGKYTLGWGHGTDHPGVGWSSRAIHIVRDNPYGPDGFNRITPLIPLGHTPPYLWSRIIGTFSGGFQNRHAAFRYGELSTTNKAHPYGFMEKGVMLASPSEDLATVIMYKDGRVDFKRWTAQDNEKLPLIRHLRQNGLPLIHRDENGKGIPGKWVKLWGPGNWSGSAEKQLRTPRGAACLIETPQDNYLVYAYFSDATPSAMARVFQAYGCNFAIQLDMNSPGQAYASLFTPESDGSSFNIEPLMTEMKAYMGGRADSPRFFIKPDYKDFFYIVKKE